ncbi:FliG C-terminal domain-containing protein [Hydrogenovibrio sp. 3SP14C1]|uniref:FliG C-terminal domain-containing protein n=1 Tax=Hydrogenovibrio sp. 3SP14C1 TaxID=3038774 RepID=UPI0024164325|nr:FliG C-terminal domain-containing protein [Hydrogenovibrio sp. 3SP14C1]MDG4812684.1 FliG C-terminal domain-containing protein [Hydrogenovibrio sp. 3SP14C1]
MKLGIKKVQENEWLIHIGYASIKMDRFSVELLNITLEHLIALEHGESHSVLNSYTQLACKIKELEPAGIQLLVRSIDNQDLLKLMQVANDDSLTQMVVENVGGILAKQLNSDLEKSIMPTESDAKAAIKRVVVKMFELESQGKIEFMDEMTQYI